MKYLLWTKYSARRWENQKDKRQIRLYVLWKNDPSAIWRWAGISQREEESFRPREAEEKKGFSENDMAMCQLFQLDSHAHMWSWGAGNNLNTVFSFKETGAVKGKKINLSQVFWFCLMPFPVEHISVLACLIDFH